MLTPYEKLLTRRALGVALIQPNDPPKVAKAVRRLETAPAETSAPAASPRPFERVHPPRLLGRPPGPPKEPKPTGLSAIEFIVARIAAQCRTAGCSDERFEAAVREYQDRRCV